MVLDRQGRAVYYRGDNSVCFGRAEGAQETAPEDVSKAELRDLLMAMRDDVIAPNCIAIQKCSDIEAPVAAWKTAPPEGRVRIPSPFYSDRALYSVSSIEGHPVADFESLLTALWNTHRDDILAGRLNRKPGGLSANDWQFVAFDDCERQEIRATLANPKARIR